MMNNCNYEAPVAEVIEINTESVILSGSGLSGIGPVSTGDDE